jgi:CHAT domain-containing protein/tetratricopeptide (TPR) repeat protein
VSPVIRVMLIALGGGLAFFIALVVIIARRKIAAGLSKMRADWLVGCNKPAYTALLRTAKRFEGAAWELPEPGGTNDWTRSDAGWATQYYERALAAYKSEGRPAADRAVAEAGLARVKLLMAQLGQAPVANLWESIEFSRRALETYTPKSNPEAWGSAQLTLAAAYCERNKSSHYDTEQAIALCEKVSECLCGRSDVDTALCAQAHCTRARAHFKQGDLHRAERHYQDALALLKPAADRKQLKSIADRRRFARALCGLGWTYLEMIRPDGEILVDEFTGIVGLERNSPPRRRRTVDLIPRVIVSKKPETMAQVKRMQQEAKVLLNRLSEAERYFQRAVSLLPKGKVPPELSDAREGVADVIEFRRQFPPELTQTIQAPSLLERAALKRRLAEVGATPRRIRQAAMKRGDLYFRHGAWNEALRAYKRAMDADKTLFYHSVTGQGRRAFAGQGELAYRRAAFCQIKMGDFDEALLTLDRGKTRVLSERLDRDQTQWDLIKDQERRQEYGAAFREYIQRVQRLEAALLTGGTRQDDKLTESVEEARDRLSRIERELRKEHPDFLAGLSVDDLPQLAADSQMAIVVPVLTGMGGAVILVTAQRGVEAVQLPCFDLLAAESLVWKLDDEVKDKVGRWLGALAAPERYEGGDSGVFAEIVASDGDGTADKLSWVPAYRLHYAVATTSRDAPDHEDAYRITQQWWRQVMQRVLEDLRGKFWPPILDALPDQVERLVMMPQGVLHLIPVGAALEREGGEPILDRYTVSYAPSLNVLHKCRQSAEATATTRPTLMAAVGSRAAGRLPYARLEAKAIAHLWREWVGTEPKLIRDGVTEGAFLEGAAYVNYIHYSGHAKHDGAEPAKSGLLVESDNALTVNEIQRKGALRMGRLVVLSACETGLVDVETAPEEYVGLPAAFLVAGVPCVISSLWPVEDLSTALLMTRFYEVHLKEDLPPSQALRAAQRWLRTETRERLVKYCESHGWMSLDVRVGLAESEDDVYANPYFWAAFITTGI